MKKEFSGDGGYFKKAVDTSGMNNEDIQKAMGISNGTFYRLYRKIEFDDNEKQAAAQALGKTVADIFGTKPDDDTKKNTDRDKKKVRVLGDAMAGNEMELAYDDVPPPDEYIDVGDLLKDSEAAFVVYGNSMTPSYPSGCGCFLPGRMLLRHPYKRLAALYDRKADR